MIDRIIRFIDRLSEWSGKITSYSLLAMIAILSIEVLMRYVFNSPTIWAHELTMYLFAATVMLGGAYALLNDGHVKMDIIYTRLSDRKKAILDIVTFLFFVIFIGALLWKGSDIACKSIKVMEKSDSAWSPYIWPSRLIVAIGALLLLLQGLVNFIKNIIYLFSKQPSHEH